MQKSFFVKQKQSTTVCLFVCFYVIIIFFIPQHLYVSLSEVQIKEEEEAVDRSFMKASLIYYAGSAFSLCEESGIAVYSHTLIKTNKQTKSISKFCSWTANTSAKNAVRMNGNK